MPSDMEFKFNGPSGPLGVALLLILGLGVMGYGGYSYLAQSSALDATETVDATVVSTAIEQVNQRRGTDDYRPQATFRYTYEGERYTSTHMYPGGVSREFETKEDAQSQLGDYEQGATVTAYVPSNSPGDAFLIHESSNKPLYITGFGAALVLGTLVSVLRN
ncbi:DUF3592 domain-containing protein [Haloferax volcanii]|uniref:DUF3592 domain-containing protein n=1 Tax=Haloferax volcanii TaxID=2246 RepID=A0A6C0UZ35_HALVO|nr:DUF3592 domain-containing protein [Haloferax alexandrinus]QIB79843.1 DUF3592 domain-containing protein [Haloferax alexandrinus]